MYDRKANLFPIRTVADLTGVNPITLRAWERRYGLIEPERTESGHRLYSDEQIDLITRVVGLLERGMRIGQVKAHLDAQQSDIQSEDREHDTWLRYRNSMIAAVIQFDESGLEESYGEALASYPVDTVSERLLVPLLAELGARWARGEGSVAEEHFFSCYLRSKLGARFHHRVRSRQGPKLLLACLPGDRHETGLLMFGLAANDAGFRIIMLGADMPLEELPAAAKKTGCDAIVLAGIQKASDAILKKDLPALVAEAPVPVMVGGRTSVETHGALRKSGAKPLGADIHNSIETLRKTLTH